MPSSGFSDHPRRQELAAHIRRYACLGGCAYVPIRAGRVAHTWSCWVYPFGTRGNENNADWVMSVITVAWGSVG